MHFSRQKSDWVVISRLKPFGPQGYPLPVRINSVATNSFTSVGWDVSKLFHRMDTYNQVKYNKPKPRAWFWQDFLLHQGFYTLTFGNTCTLWGNSIREVIYRLMFKNTKRSVIHSWGTEVPFSKTCNTGRNLPLEANLTNFKRKIVQFTSAYISLISGVVIHSLCRHKYS